MIVADSHRRGVTLRRLRMVSRRRPTSNRPGRRQGCARGAGADFAEFREYSPGDDLRHVDWSLYSRVGKLYTRSFLAEAELDVHLLLDVSASMVSPTPAKLEHAKAVALAVAAVGLGYGDRVGLATFSDRIHAIVRPERGIGQLGRIRDVLLASSAAGRTHFRKSFRDYFSVAGSGRGLFVVLSDLFSQNGYRKGLRWALYRGHELILLHVLDQQEVYPRVEGPLDLMDAETDDDVRLTVGPEWLPQYRIRLHRFCESLSAFSARHDLACVRTTSSESFADVNRALLQGGVWQRR